MKTQIKKIVTMILCIITISSSSMAQKIDIIDNGRTIDVLTDFLNIKEKLIAYKDTNLWIRYDKKWETVEITMYDENMDEKNFIIYYKGVITKKDLWYPSRLYCKKIKKGHHFTIMMEITMNEKWFFTMDDNGSGGFYKNDENGNLCREYRQVSQMSREEISFFGNELYKILCLVR